jgi:ubiquinol-cytochrome c reductase cytochrome b subunit
MAQIDVEGKIIASTPIIGPTIQRLLIGGNSPGNLTLTHLYFLHVGLMPILVFLVLGLHVAQVYRHAVSTVDEQGDEGKTCAYWPHQTFRNMVVLSVVVGVIAYLTWRFGAPLDPPADSSLPHTPRPEWYFRWLFELRRYLTGDWEFLATVILPVVVLAYFLLLPVVDRVLRRSWSAALRILTVLIGAGVVGGLTWVSCARDWEDKEYLASEEATRELAARAQFLAKSGGLPVEGAITLLRNDPKTQGPALYRRHCAACHPYSDANGQGIVSQEASAPNLYGFGTPQWIAGVLDPDRFVSPQYFGKTKFVDGDMASKLREMFDEAKDVGQLTKQMAAAARALSAEAKLPLQAEADKRDAAQIAEGVTLIQGDLSCTECHRHGDEGELGSAPDLTGYGSREWLAGIISNPKHERFYPDDRNDRMPAFASDPQQPHQNILSPRELDMLVSWLRGEWKEEPAASAK